MGLFLLGPLAGVWWLKGNLSTSMVLDTVPLADPLAVLQSLFSGHLPEWTALAGAAIVAGFYTLAGGAGVLQLGVPGQHDHRCCCQPAPETGDSEPVTSYPAKPVSGCWGQSC